MHASDDWLRWTAQYQFQSWWEWATRESALYSQFSKLIHLLSIDLPECNKLIFGNRFLPSAMSWTSSKSVTKKKRLILELTTGDWRLVDDGTKIISKFNHVCYSFSSRMPLIWAFKYNLLFFDCSFYSPVNWSSDSVTSRQQQQMSRSVITKVPLCTLQLMGNLNISHGIEAIYVVALLLVSTAAIKAIHEVMFFLSSIAKLFRENRSAWLLSISRSTRRDDRLHAREEMTTNPSHVGGYHNPYVTQITCVKY